ncbi:MAG: hypothetical protein Q8N17_00050, partial [Burkholderiaceae bacterium]|nr:hypothetical protein [Burkholderiaceae bacterium]
MAKDDNGGLLSKVVKFVRNPTTNWADLDTQDADKESSYSKQMLKEMIERKRRNDFVRKREFDMLRTLRRSEAMAGQDPTARPSFFQSSMPSKPDDRAMTLKKIDEIEAQMSMQWWKTKHGDSTLRSGFNPSSRGPLTSNSQPLSTSSQPLSQTSTQPGLYGRTEPAPLPTHKVRPAHSSIQTTQPYNSAGFAPPPSFANTDPSAQGPAGGANAQQNRSGAPQRGGAAVGGLEGSYDGSASGFTASKLFAVEVD